MKEKLFSALLTHVPFDGWSHSALRHAAKEVGMDMALACDYFPDALTMIDHHHRLIDGAMIIPDQGGISAKVRAAILSRFDYVWHDREAVRRGVNFLSLPPNLYAATKMSYRSADAIWTAVGSYDRGFDWATKRTSLVAIYSATLLFWLSETGQDRLALEAYLDRQLSRLLKVMKPINEIRTRFAKPFMS